MYRAMMTMMLLATVTTPLMSQPPEVGTDPFAYTRGECHQFSVTPDGKRMAVCGYVAQNVPGKPVLKGGYVVWTFSDRKRVSMGSMEASAYVVAISPNGKLVALGGDTGISPLGKGQYVGSVELRIFDAETGKRSPNLDGHVQSFGPGKLAFTPDSKYLVSLADDNMIRVWTTADQKPYAKYCFKIEEVSPPDWQKWTDRPHEKAKITVIHESKNDRVWHFDISPNGQSLAVATGTREVFLLECLTGKESGRVTCEKIKKCRAVGYSPDGSLLYVWGWIVTQEEDGVGHHRTEIWEVGTKKLVGTLENSCCAAIRSDNQTLVAQDGAGICIWDLKAKKVKHRLLTNDENNDWIINNAAFVNEGKTLLMSTGNLINLDVSSAIQFWDVESGRKMERLAEK